MRAAGQVRAAEAGARADLVPTGLGGTLLVRPQMLLPLSLDADGLVTTFDVPCDESVCGLEPHLQALEVDPGAPRGVSFSAGLRLVFGN